MTRNEGYHNNDLVDLKTGKIVLIPIYSLAKDPDPKIIENRNSLDCLAQVCVSGKISNLPYNIDALAINSYGKLIASIRYKLEQDNELLHIWNLDGNQVQGRFRDGCRDKKTHKLHSVMTPDGRILVAANDNKIKVWDIQTEEEIYSLKGHTNKIENLAIASDGRILASYAQNEIIIWSCDQDFKQKEAELQIIRANKKKEIEQKIDTLLEIFESNNKSTCLY